jgi:hypothetical protein
MAAEYRIFEDTILGHGPGAVKASSIDPSHGQINYDNPMDIEVPDTFEPSLRWVCLNGAAEAAMKALIEKKNADDQCWTDGRNEKHTDTGTHQREKFFSSGRVGKPVQSAVDQGFTVKPKEEEPEAPVHLSDATVIPEADAPKKRGRPRKAI